MPESSHTQFVYSVAPQLLPNTASNPPILLNSSSHELN